MSVLKDRVAIVTGASRGIGKAIVEAFAREGASVIICGRKQEALDQLAEMGEHQLTIRDYLRHSNLSVTNKYLQATSETKRSAQDKLVGAILPTGLLSQSKTTLIQ